MMPAQMTIATINLDVRPPHITVMTIMPVPRIVVIRIRVVNTNKFLVMMTITALMIFVAL
jgi:hypothetical protein